MQCVCFDGSGKKSSIMDDGSYESLIRDTHKTGVCFTQRATNSSVSKFSLHGICLTDQELETLAKHCVGGHLKDWGVENVSCRVEHFVNGLILYVSASGDQERVTELIAEGASLLQGTLTSFSNATVELGENSDCVVINRPTVLSQSLPRVFLSVVAIVGIGWLLMW